MQLSSYFGREKCPDFNEAISSLLYVCRLSNIYALHYYIMYSLLIPVLAENNIRKLNTHVFGCGSMIDALSLSYAMKDLGKSFDVHYTGVDIAKWAPFYDHPFEWNFIQKPLQEYWDDCPVFDGNVIFFPTVLSEISEYPDEIGQFCAGLEKTKITSDTLILMASYRSAASVDKDWKVTDWQKFYRVISTLEKMGYSADHIPVSLPDDWKTYLQCKTLKTEDGRSYPCYYLSPPCDAVSVSDIAPDFAPSKPITEYLTKPGNIRLNCSYYSKKRDRYLENNKSVSADSVIPDAVCRQTCHIICHPYPKVVLSPMVSPCFQIFVLHRK